jgi:hypothetical protein
LEPLYKFDVPQQSSSNQLMPRVMVDKCTWKRGLARKMMNNLEFDGNDDVEASTCSFWKKLSLDDHLRITWWRIWLIVLLSNDISNDIAFASIGELWRFPYPIDSMVNNSKISRIASVFKFILAIWKSRVCTTSVFGGIFAQW